jgi:hypothetical protein
MGSIGQSSNFPLYCTHCVSAGALVAISLAFFLAGHLGTAMVATANIGDSIISAPGIFTYAASFRCVYGLHHWPNKMQCRSFEHHLYLAR